MLKDLSDRVFSNRKLLLLLVIVNLLGFLAGMSVYYPQMTETSPYLWIIVVDCPLAVLLFAIVCSLICLKVKIPNILEFLTSVYLIKFGIWTMLTIALYWNYYSAYEFLGILTFILHAGMVLEGIILIPRISPNKYNTVILLALLLLNDYFDYFLGTYPVVPPEYLGFLMTESFISTVLIIPSIFLYKKILTGSKYSFS